MNDRYICRGKRKDNGEWVYGYYDVLDDYDRHLIIDLQGNIHEVIPEMVERCTGRIDKNNKRIFEGDIVKLTDVNSGIKWITYVVFKNDQSWNLMYIGEEPRINTDMPLWIEMKEAAQCEVIGNIHDDDLLEEDKKMDTEWILKAVETIKSGIADKLTKDNITIYRVKNIIRIDIKE